MKRLLPIFLLLGTLHAVTYHAVSASGAGSHSGADWNNSYVGLPGTLVRGDVYCLADGSYAAYNFNTATSGTATIEIRKAQSYDANCAGLAGWNTSTMGSSQAVLSHTFTVSTDFLILNGNGTQSAVGCGNSLAATSVTASPPTPSDCGIKIDDTTCSSNCAHPLYITFNAGLTSLLFEYLEWAGQSTVAANEDMFVYAYGNSGITYTHIYGHDTGAQYIQYGGQGSTVSYSYFWGTQRQGVLQDGQHGQAEEYCCTDSNATRHHNIYRDITGTANWSFVQIGGGGTLNNWTFYDNIIWNSNGFNAGCGSVCYGLNTNGVLACINATVVCTNFVFVQNTIVNKGYNSGVTLCDVATGCTGTAQNNLWYLSQNSSGSPAPPGFIGHVTLTQDHNSFLQSGSGCSTGTGNVCDGSSANPFTSWTTGDFTLASDAADWNNRISLSPPYTIDIVGTTFATDRGAYQFISSSGSMTCSPSTVPANHSGNIALACTGVGTTWTPSTIFTVNGLAGTSLVSYSNHSNTLETVTITTGSATGSTSINDATDSISTTVTVATATLSISPTSGNTATTPPLTLTGTNTLWSSEVASTLFSISGAGCSGDSLGTPSVTTNTAATAVLTTGGALCTITVRDNSTTATATFTVTGNWLAKISVTGVGSVSDSLGYFTNCTLSCTALIPNGSVDTFTETTSLPYVNAGFSSLSCPVTVESNLPCTVTITSAISLAASFLTPQLPQTWVNSGEYVGKTTNLVNFPTFWLCGATRYPASGNYANSQAGLQAAINDAETCRTNTGAGTWINIPPGVYTGANGINLPQTAGDTSSNFIVLTSSTPLRSGVTACSHGIQDNIPSATQPGLRNIGCTGTNMYYQLGPTINTVPVGAFTLANGQSSNTASYNDVASMYTIEATGNNSNAIQTCAVFTGLICTSGWDTNNVGSHHYAILNAELRPGVGLTGPAAPFSIGQGSETQVSQIPTHIHLAYSYLHGDWTDAPLTGCPSACVATAGPTGANSLPNIVVFSGCIYCSLMYNYMDRALRPGSEGHAISLLLAQQLKIAHNWVEGQSIGRFCGGQASQIMIPGFLGCQDVEERGNRYTYPFSWILANGSGTLRQVNKNGTGVGSGYLAGDVITVVETGASGGTATVNTVGAGGTLLTMTPLTLGTGYVISSGLSVTGGSGTGGLVNITTGYFPNGGTTDNYVRKNGSEQKVSERFLSDGNIFENVDGSGAQNGTVISSKTDNNSNVTAVANNWITNENDTYTNLILRGSCNGPSWGYRSNTVGGDGNGTTLPTQKSIWQNVLLYWYGINNPGCGGVSPQFGFRFASGGTAAIWPSGQVAASRNAAGIVTLTLTSSLAPDLSVSSTNVGDPVNVFGCTTDPTFNTGNTNQGPPALPGTLVNGLTVVYQSTTLGVSSDNTCSFNNGQGWPNYTIVNHISDFSTTPGTQNDPQSSSLAGTNPYNFIRNTYITNAVVVGGGFNSTFAEGTRTETKAFDALSLVFNNTVMAGRDSAVTCPGHASPAPGGMAACYTEYTNTFQAITPATVYGAPSGNCTGATPSASCVGIVGAMSQSSFPTFLSDFTQYRLCHASDAATCSGTPSVFASGQSSQSPDGTDLGVNISSILTAETSVLYSCTTPCGSGPFLDVGAIIPASAPQVMGDNVISEPNVGYFARRMQ